MSRSVVIAVETANLSRQISRTCQRHTADHRPFGRQVDTGGFSDAVASTAATLILLLRATHKAHAGRWGLITGVQACREVCFVILELSDMRAAWKCIIITPSRFASIQLHCNTAHQDVRTRAMYDRYLWQDWIWHDRIRERARQSKSKAERLMLAAMI